MNKILFLTIFAILVCGIYADDEDAHAEIIRYVNNIHHDGKYNYHYETSNGITGEEKGEGGHFAKGGFAYYSDDQKLYQLSYTADELGFHPIADHVPRPHPIPAAILRAIEYIRTHPHEEKESRR
ncbi:pupal cuticle protein Edg-78E-like [Musca autumnalis]|uniref:pupal cuticle protein Edg-78E-like n=1 Tax=Musca autumnalis TaxID=221902 RepID=UPI003CF0034F